MEGKTPKEGFPQIGTVEKPAIFSDGYDLLVSYEVAPSDGGGSAILAFKDVTYFEKNGDSNVEGLRSAKYPCRPWEFTEVVGSDRNSSSPWFERRFWTISFMDLLIEIVFAEVALVHRAPKPAPPHLALLKFLSTGYRPLDR